MIKKRLCVFITNYGDNNKEYLHRLLEELNNFKNNHVTAYLFSTENDDYSRYENIKTINYVFDKNIRQALAFQHLHFIKSQFAELEKNHDVFIGLENDILLREETVDYFNEQMQYINQLEYSIGTLRYENKNNQKWYIDLHVTNIEKAFEYAFTLNGDRFYKTNINPHSGLWIFNKEQLSRLININRDWTPHELEVSITGFYKSPWPGTDGGIQKIVPLSCFEKVETHHMPDKYVNYKEWNALYKCETKDDIFEFEQKEFKKLQKK